MGILNSLSTAVTNALKRAATPAEPDVAMMKLLDYKADSPCRNREANKPSIGKLKAKNRKAAKLARKARKK
jgi:hypothetical protein